MTARTMTKMTNDTKPSNARRRFHRGFTLLEMMLVMLLIGGLTAIVVAINFIGQAEQARIDLTIVKMRTISQQLTAYSFRHGSYPTSDQGLGELITSGYVEQAMLSDEWGNPFAYYAPTSDPAKPYDLISDGPDGIPDSEDDIDFWYIDQDNQ